MFTEERHNIILQELKAKGIVSVTDLTKLLDASESTVRRDLNHLDKEGLLKKIHGGASLIVESTSSHDYTVNLRQSLNLEDKKLIAKYAASLIKEGDVIYIDAGATTELIINYISLENITVVTNGIVHAKKLLEKNINTYILGGKIKGITEAIVGINAVSDLGKYNFAKGFFGTNGITDENGFTTPDIEEGMVKKAAIKKCSEAYVLADVSKCEQVSFMTFADIDECSLITTKLNGNTSFNTNVIGVI